MHRIGWAALLLPVWACAQHARDAGFSYEQAFDTIEIPYYDRVALTADGQRIAYTSRRKPADTGPSEKFDPQATLAFYMGAKIQLIDRRGGETRVQPMCEGAGNSWAGAWSRDDSKFAFIADAGGKPGLWVYDGEACRQLGTVVLGGELGAAPLWSADDRKLYVTAPELEPAADRRYLRSISCCGRSARLATSRFCDRAARGRRAGAPDPGRDGRSDLAGHGR